MSADAAEQILRDNVDGELLAEPRLIKFATGMRKHSWNHNVVSIGLSSGFLEPLESTSIHLIQHGIARFIALFPEKQISAVERDEYNRSMRQMYEDVRDFVILHYKATQRDDSAFWRYVRDMAIPENLARKIELWRRHGRVFREQADIFLTPSWAAVMLGQNIWPEQYDPIVDTLNVADCSSTLTQMRDAYRKTALQMPTHEEYLRRSGAWHA